MVKVADQAAELAFMNGLKVSPTITESLLPTPTVSDTFTASLGSTQQTLGSLHSVSLAQIVNRADLLPTPTLGHIRNYDEPVQDYLDRKAKGASGEYRGTPGISLGVAVRMELLPTPTTQDSKNTGGVSQFERNTLPLNAEVTLLGTPRTSTINGSTKKQVEANAPKSRIEDQVLTKNWGRFGAAIARWEAVTGRPAPDATKPDGKDGAHRLSENFTEWLMGLPEGWITGVGLTRNEALKACGNGVVPQQAELALRILLENTKIEGINK
jgi:hypothetical protein